MVVQNTNSEASVPGADHRSSDALLKDVWERHRVYSDNAARAQNRFFLIRRILAYLSVAIVVLAVAQPSIKANCTILNGSQCSEGFNTDALITLIRQIVAYGNGSSGSIAESAGSFLLIILPLVNFLLILLPIIVTGMIAFAVKFDRGNSWVLLRGNSEALKMEIFLYRTQAGEYRQNRNTVLVNKVQQISDRIKSSSVHEAALMPYEWEPQKRIQKGWVFRKLEQAIKVSREAVRKVWQSLFQFESVTEASELSAATAENLKSLPKEDYEYQKKYADLDAEKYLYFRLEKQFDWYRHKCKQYDRQNQILQTSIYFFAGLGTLFAAVEQQYLIPISAAVSTALVNYLEYRRVEATLVGYNQAADALYDIHVWWQSLSLAARKKKANFEKLVLKTEETIRIEHGSWLQDMQERLASLYGEEEGTGTRTEEDEDLPVEDLDNDQTLANTPTTPKEPA